MKRCIATALLFYFGLAQLYIFSQSSQIPVCLSLTDDPTQKDCIHSFNINRGDTLELYAILNRKLLNIQSEGYLTANIINISYGDSVIKVLAQRNKLFKWETLTIAGLSDEDIRKTGIKERKFIGSKISAKNVTSIIDAILSYLENNGYPFARAKLRLNEINGAYASAILEIVKEQHYIIDEFYIKGFDHFGAHYLYRQIGIKPGISYNEQQIKNISQNIKNITFFEEMRQVEVEFGDSLADLFLYLKKKKANKFYGILGIAPSDQTTGKLLLTGELSFQLTNAIKKGESIRFNWNKLEQGSQNLTLGINYPFLFKTPLGIDASFLLDKQDSSYLNTNSRLGIIYSYIGGNSIQLFYNKINSNKLSNLVENIKSSSTNLIGMGINHTRINYLLNPSSGYFIDLKVATGSKRINDTESENSENKQTSVLANCGAYLPIGRKATIYLHSQTKLIQSKELYVNELYRLGGLYTVRGFDEQSLNASFYEVVTIEPRYLFEKNSNVFLFIDAAYFEENYENFQDKNYILGFGLGTSFQTRAGIFTINYALGKEENMPVQFKNAKIHFGFSNIF